MGLLEVRPFVVNFPLFGREVKKFLIPSCEGTRVSRLLFAGNRVSVFRSYARAFITWITKGSDAGMAAFRLLSVAFKWFGRTTFLIALSNQMLDLDATFPLLETIVDGGKLARYAANITRFLKALSIVGLFADAFILAFAVSDLMRFRLLPHLKRHCMLLTRGWFFRGSISHKGPSVRRCKRR